VAVGPDTRAGAPRFPETRWTRIVAARDRPDLRREVLGELCATRWQPLYVHLRKQGLPRERAEDVVQGFLVHLLERDFLARLDPGRGRLRAYLKAALAHYQANLHEQESAQKRGGGARALAFDDVEALVPAAPDDPAAAFDREWALALFEGALAELEAELASGARRGPVAVVRQLFRLGEAPAYEALAAEHGMSVPQLKSFVHRARGRFRLLLLARVADTVQTRAEADAELGELLKALAA
jgi:RNA polymerase sigma-70 factor (ECF subfamily)